jgi:hypothetical protein
VLIDQDHVDLAAAESTGDAETTKAGADDDHPGTLLLQPFAASTKASRSAWYFSATSGRLRPMISAAR